MPAADPITFAGGALDRAGERRTDEAWVAAQRADPRARAIVAGGRGVLLDGEPPPLGGDAWETGDGAPLAPVLAPLREDAPAHLLGIRPDGAPLFAQAAADGDRLIDLRQAAPLLSAADAGLLAYAASLLHWHRTHRFCGRCGAPTVARDAGHMLVCEHDHRFHPRTDPVVIMLVTDGGDRVLLGRQPPWPPRRYSALAGFVEPGENLESAVRREVREEAGITVGEVRYVASQPWPFPASLMLGFEAVADPPDQVPAVGDAELEDVRWFTRAEVAASLRGIDGPLLLPPRLAIARRLVEHWLA